MSSISGYDLYITDHCIYETKSDERVITYDLDPEKILDICYIKFSDGSGALSARFLGDGEYTAFGSVSGRIYNYVQTLVRRLGLRMLRMDLREQRAFGITAINERRIKAGFFSHTSFGEKIYPAVRLIYEGGPELIYPLDEYTRHSRRTLIKIIRTRWGKEEK